MVVIVNIYSMQVLIWSCRKCSIFVSNWTVTVVYKISFSKCYLWKNNGFKRCLVQADYFLQVPNIIFCFDGFCEDNVKAMVHTHTHTDKQTHLSPTHVLFSFQWHMYMDWQTISTNPHPYTYIKLSCHIILHCSFKHQSVFYRDCPGT